MYIIRGNFFGYFIASSYSCTLFVALLFVQVLTPSFFAVAMIVVCDAYFLADPFGSPTLPLLVVVAFCMRYIFWQCVGKAIAAKFLAVWEIVRVDVLFVRLPAGATSCAQFDAVSWWGRTVCCR